MLWGPELAYEAILTCKTERDLIIELLCNYWGIFKKCFLNRQKSVSVLLEEKSYKWEINKTLEM